MASPASIARHPIHPMVVVFPIALWIFSFISDIIFYFQWGGPVWNDVAYRTMAGGIIGAIFAAVPGLIDYLSLEGRRKSIATTHMILNLTLVLLFALNLWLRYSGVPVVGAPIILSLISIILLFISGWLGGALVYVHATAVECEPHESQISAPGDMKPFER